MIRCIDRETNAAYPWHDEVSRTGHCGRCGEVTDAATHTRVVAELRRLADAASRRASDWSFGPPPELERRDAERLRAELACELARPVARN